MLHAFYYQLGDADVVGVCRSQKFQKRSLGRHCHDSHDVEQPNELRFGGVTQLSSFDKPVDELLVVEASVNLPFDILVALRIDLQAVDEFTEEVQYVLQASLEEGQKFAELASAYHHAEEFHVVGSDSAVEVGFQRRFSRGVENELDVENNAIDDEDPFSVDLIEMQQASLPKAFPVVGKVV